MAKPRHLWNDVICIAVERIMKEAKYFDREPDGKWDQYSASAWKAYCERFGFKFSQEPDFGLQTPDNQAFLEAECLKVATELNLADVELKVKGAKNLVPETIKITDDKNGGEKEVDISRQFDKMNQKARLNEQIAAAMAAENSDNSNNQSTTSTDTPEQSTTTTAAPEQPTTPAAPQPNNKQEPINMANKHSGFNKPNNQQPRNTPPSADILKTRGNK